MSFIHSYFLEYQITFRKSIEDIDDHCYLVLINNSKFSQNTLFREIETLFEDKSPYDIENEVKSLKYKGYIVYRVYIYNYIKTIDDLDESLSMSRLNYCIMNKTYYHHYKIFYRLLEWLYKTALINEEFSSIIGRLLVCYFYLD